ncbi:MAG: hypothetical protein WCG27_00945 [Pseudomonadota bacterium]
MKTMYFLTILITLSLSALSWAGQPEPVSSRCGTRFLPGSTSPYPTHLQPLVNEADNLVMQWRYYLNQLPLVAKGAALPDNPEEESETWTKWDVWDFLVAMQESDNIPWVRVVQIYRRLQVLNNKFNDGQTEKKAGLFDLVGFRRSVEIDGSMGRILAKWGDEIDRLNLHDQSISDGTHPLVAQMQFCIDGEGGKFLSLAETAMRSPPPARIFRQAPPEITAQSKLTPKDQQVLNRALELKLKIIELQGLGADAYQPKKDVRQLRHQLDDINKRTGLGIWSWQLIKLQEEAQKLGRAKHRPSSFIRAEMAQVEREIDRIEDHGSRDHDAGELNLQFQALQRELASQEKED